MAQLDLLPLDANGNAPLATHVAVNDGDWFDPATWSTGTVPDQGAVVHIPEGVSVDYSGTSEADIFLIRVDGTFTMSAPDGAETVLSVDTMITSMGSTLNMMAGGATDGTIDVVFTEADPADIPAHYADSSAGDGVIGRSSWDPEQLSLGLVASGEVNIKGQPTLGTMQLDEGAAAGATQLVFDAETPLSGSWQPGDQVVVGGTAYLGRDENDELITQDEVRTITAVEVVDGKLVVTLDQPLEHDHTGPADPDTGAEMTGYVANLTRNVNFSSAVADQDGDGMVDRGLSLGEEAGPLDHYVTERGHVMFMHNDDVVVTDTGFIGLGRTDKSEGLDDYQLTNQGANNFRLYDDVNGNGIYDEGIDTPVETPPEEITNMRGRYALHIHQAGTDGAGDHGDHQDLCPVTGDIICRCSGDGDNDDDGRPDTDFCHEGAQIAGNVVWGSPGWGMVQHSSVADLVDNVAFDVAGSAFVSESGDEVGTWSKNAAFGTYGARPLVGNDDSDDFNEDSGFEGIGFYMKSRALVVEDNIAHSSARSGFMWHTNGVGLEDVSTEHLEELGVDAVAKGQDTASATDVPILGFEGNRVIAAHEGIRIISDPTDSVRKFNDAWSHMKDFVAWEVDESGVSITYSSKYIFEDFLILGTEEKLSDNLSDTAGFLLQASVADITIVRSHVENFQNAYTDWAQIGDRQEYRRGFWDPRKPSSVLDKNDMEHTKGIGTEEGIENPYYNLWNINLVDVSWSNIDGAAKIRVKAHALTDEDGVSTTYKAYEQFNTTNSSTDDDPDEVDSVQIELVDDSAQGGLVALWREDIANNPDQAAMLEQYIPLAYRETAYVSQIRWDDGSVSKRAKYTDYIQGINDDIWSGTVLEFAKTDSLGRHVFAYDDFSPMNPEETERAVSTNERIVFSKEDIDATLASDGYYHLDGASDMKFVEVKMLFTDRLTGDMVTKGFLVALDLAWEIDEGVEFRGIYQPTEDSIVAEKYAYFENGEQRTDLGVVVQQFDVMRVSTDAGDVPLLGGSSDIARAGSGGFVASAGGTGEITGTEGDDTLLGTSGKDTIDGLDGDDILVADMGDDILYGGAGNDQLRGGGGVDSLDGGDGMDVLIGGNDDDFMAGGAGDDILNGGNGNDTMDGGDGNDELVGGSGINILTGGAGADRFVFGSFEAEDWVTDFEEGVDAIDILVDGLGFGDLEFTQDGRDLRIEYETSVGDNVIILKNVWHDQMSEDSFTFN